MTRTLCLLQFVCGLVILLFTGTTLSHAKATYSTTTNADATGTIMVITSEAEGDLADDIANAKAYLSSKSTTMFALSGNFKATEVAQWIDHVKGTVTWLSLKDATIDEFTVEPTVWAETKTADGKTTSYKSIIKCSFLPADTALSIPTLTYFSLPKIKSETGKFAMPDGSIQQPEKLNAVLTAYNHYFAQVMPNLTTLYIPDGYTTIGRALFCKMYSLKKVRIPTTLETVRPWAFEYDSKLSTFLTGEEGLQYRRHTVDNICRFPEGMKKIESSAFEDHNFNVIVFPESMEEISGYSFRQTWASHHVQDIYLLGSTLPKCGMNAFILGGNNITFPTGYARRKDYVDKNGRLLPMLHVRPDLSAEQRALITDDTRVYTIKDRILGEGRLWPTSDEYSKVSIYLNSFDTPKDFAGTAYPAERKPYLGFLTMPLVRYDAPTSDYAVPYSPGGQWYSVCLPCDMEADELKAQFGSDVELYSLTSVVRNADTHRIYLHFNTKSETLEAFKPYIIRHTNGREGDNYTALVRDLKFEPGSETGDSCKATCATGSKVETYTDGQGNTTNVEWTYLFTGNNEGLYHKSGVATTNVAVERPRYSYYLGAVDGEVSWYYQQTDKQRIWKPYTCSLFALNGEYQTSDTPGQTVDDTFRDADGTLLSKAQILSSFGFLDDDDPTAIGGYKVTVVTPDQSAQGNIYNLNGQLVRAHAESTDGLPAGIYVCNGRKLLVK